MGADFPDFHNISVIRGWDGTNFTNIKVKSSGELYILLSALFGTTVTPLKCDALGNAFFNVKGQDLAEIINRVKYGACASVGSYLDIVGGGISDLFEISGKGIIYGGRIYVNENLTHKSDSVFYVIDGTTIGASSFDNFNDYGFTQPYCHQAFLTYYDDVNFVYSFGLTPGITFESSLKLRYRNNHVTDTVRVHYFLLYALV